MSADLPSELGRLAKGLATRACWTQWVALGGMAYPIGSWRSHSIVDIEALLLASLNLVDQERRLRDLTLWWAGVGSHLTSVQRTRALAARFPARTGSEGLEAFASMAAGRGDRRWSRHAGVPVPAEGRSAKGPEELRLMDPAALLPRLRAAFGVGAKADTLAFLLGSAGAWASVNGIAFATGYSTVSIRKATEEMAMARLIRETDGRPSEYHAPPKPWREILDLLPPDQGRDGESPPPRWRYWSEIFAFLLGVIEWSRMACASPAPNEHVLASTARDILEGHQRVFKLNSIPVPVPEAFPGLRAPKGLDQTTRAVSEWMEGAL